MGKVSSGGARDRASDRPPNAFSLHRSGSLPRSDWTPSVTSVYLACAWKSISGWCQNRQVSDFESKARACQPTNWADLRCALGVNCWTGSIWFARRAVRRFSCPAPFAKIFRFAPEANQFTESHRPVPQRGDRASSRTRGGMRWTWERQARNGNRRARWTSWAVSWRARWSALERTAKPCGSDTRCWCQAGGGEIKLDRVWWTL